MTRKTSKPIELFFLVGLLVALFCCIQGKTCSVDGDCMPVVDCHIIPWTCNGSNYVEGTPAPTVDPSSQRCCIHLDTCGGEIEVAGWINVRNTTVTVDGVEYKAEWLDTFITEGNATEPTIIKSAYVGSWNTLKEGGISYPSQMFVAEPTNSCSVDGVAKWPEWYQVTANILTSVSDETLGIEAYRNKDCLCDAEWACLDDSLCHVATVGMSSNKANLSLPNTDIQTKVVDYCQSAAVVNITNYTASSYFAVGFVPSMGKLDSFNYSMSVEGGWAPDLEDDLPWFEIQLAEDTMISGIETQGMATNPERRVDEFTVEYEAETGGVQTVGSEQVFVAGARLDTKTLNLFPTPVKANRIRLNIKKPCDAYYVGLRISLVGCHYCTSNEDCTIMDYGVCETENFCSYIVPTTLEPTTTFVPTTTMPTTPGQTTAPGTTKGSTSAPEGTTAPVTTVTSGTSGTSGKASTVAGADRSTEAPGTTAATTAAQPTGPPASTPTTNSRVSTPPAPTTTSSGTSAFLQTSTPPQRAIQDKIAEFDDLTQDEVDDLREVLTISNPDTTNVDVTENFVLKGLEVIQNITLDANSTKDMPLQEQIIAGAQVFFELVSEASELTTEPNGGLVFEKFTSTASTVLHVDMSEDPVTLLSFVTSVENVATKVASTGTADITIQEDNMVGSIMPYQADASASPEDFQYEFPSTDNSDEVSKVTISSDSLNTIDLPVNTSLSIVVLKINVPLGHSTGNATERLSSSILSISVVGGSQDYSIPVEFILEHEKKFDNETQHCSFWVQKTSQTEAKWSTSGCDTDAVSDTETKCSCSHMTNYAVLMWLGPEPVKENSTLDTITTVGCLVSIIALIVALGLLAYLKSSLSSERIIIHMHLMGVTLVALIIFLTASDKTESKPLCQFITIALHFFYMSMFSWMLVEGIHLYRQIVAVFETGKSRLWIYFVIGWGIPVIIVGISTGINFDKYGTHQLCWLDVSDGSIWAFIGPMIPICLANLVVLFMVCRIVVSAAKMQAEKPGFNSAKAGVRSSLLLLPILGVTWIFGYFAALSEPLMYVFVALNSFQGFFMALFHCFMSGEVNTALKQKIRKVKDSSIGGASSVDSTSKPAMFTSGGMRKVKVSPTMTEQTEPF